MLDKENYIFGEIFERDCNFPPQIYYVKTDHAWEFVRFAKIIPNKFVVVSHNSDHAITQDLADKIDNTLPNLIKWYGQNIDCVNDRIESLPIGLENTKNWTKFSKKDMIFESSKVEIKPSKLVYANFSLWTNPTERNNCYKFVSNSNFITNHCSQTVIQDNFQFWLDQVLDHKFVLCPRGNGIDTHRLWETLYLGRIPITKKLPNTRFYEKLPILLVDDWDEITEQFLNSKFDFYSDRSNFDLELLDIRYWLKKIKNEIIL